MSTSRDRQFEHLLREGILAAKHGNRNLARRALNQALILNKVDARPYLWLSATTDDPEEQRDYLERAVAADPTNIKARRGLAILLGKVDPNQLMPEGVGLEAGEENEQIETKAQTFKCPQCGGRMSFSVGSNLLACEYCGFEQQPVQSRGPTPIADQAEQVFDFVMPTTRGHRWAEAQHRLSCEHCGAVSLLDPGQKASRCAYCGSNQLIDSPEHGELVDPQVIALMQIDGKEAAQRVRKWLGRGVFTPDNLLLASQGLRLRPAYYSCWTFDGTLEARWSCEVKEGSGNYETWTPISGVETKFFNDILVSGVQALTGRELKSLEPFNLEDVEEFKPEFLAGWPTVIYDRPLSDASLLAREKVIRQMRSQMHNSVAAGQEKRNLRIGAGAWSGMTFKHILLPVWIGAYQFRGEEFHLLVNGQTGKVGGAKPRDKVKLIFSLLIVMLFIVLFIVIYWVWTGLSGG